MAYSEPTINVTNSPQSRWSNSVEERTQEFGQRLFAELASQKPSVFDSAQWMGKVMNWAMSKPDFRVRLLHFVDAFPTFQTGEQLQRAIQEYFTDEESDVPAFLRVGAQSSGLLGKVGSSVVGTLIRKNLESMAQHFIIGADSKTALKRMEKIRKDDYAVVLDLLGEAVVSEKEADEHQAIYLHLLDRMHEHDFDPLGTDSEPQLDWGSQPIAQVSIKPSALYSRVDPMNFEGSVAGILTRLEPIAAKAVETGAALCLDMESYALKDITIEVFKRMRSHQDFRQHPHFGLVLQAYLRETEQDLRQLLDWMKKDELPSAIRLVKGAYWDYETVIAAQNGWPDRVWQRKPQTDVNFERCARILLENSDICYFACGSHNLRSVAMTLAHAEDLGVPDSRYEFQVLYGMAEPIRQAIFKTAGRMRLYAPFGELIPGMAYLVRRILENTANDSFLRHTFGDDMDPTILLANPADQLEENEKPHESPRSEGFTNFPATDFTREESRQEMREAIAQVRESAPELPPRPLFIGGEEITTERQLKSTNPNRPSEQLGKFCLAGPEEVATTVKAAKDAFQDWKRLSMSARATYLRKAAEIARQRRWELAAWQVLEVGKQWHEATADVAESIDFLNYYAVEAERLEGNDSLMRLPGEDNRLSYGPRGVTSVIAPWNFPLAISVGMASAALVTGNTVVYKPAGASALVGYHLVELFREAGIPAGVFNYLPGNGSEIGDLLVDHPDIATIAFTGSMEVGLRIIERASVVQSGQRHVKRVIAEMGGKNAIIIDEDADLDEAVPQVLYSAFGFQGQKCSACSRVITVGSVHDRFVKRLVEAAKAWKIGPSEDPANDMGAVIDANARKKIRDLELQGALEGTVVHSSELPFRQGYYTPMTIIDGIRPEHHLAREEVFGPVLAIMEAEDFDQAIDWANQTRYALTGALFSRTPSHLDRARADFDVGNLYLNRGSTGAIVGRQAFGGAAMSGVGSKAGGPDYLLQFVNPKTITENTMRRGFAPEES